MKTLVKFKITVIYRKTFKLINIKTNNVKIHNIQEGLQKMKMQIYK